MFKSTITLFDQYCAKLEAQAIEGFNRDLASEVRQRLGELGYIIAKVRQLQASTLLITNELRIEAPIRSTHSPVVSFANNLMEITIFSEAFYYSASRIRHVLRNSKSPIPGLSKFECEGIRNTRNKLIEHPEGQDSEIFFRNIGLGGIGGPTIKAIRLEHQNSAFLDKGLFENAEEFRANLERVLSRNLDK